jgi:23S rRNA (uracil1939-C5)-methyltransferase
MTEVVRIDRIGSRGDGIAETPAGPVFVPFALPGERVAIEREGERGRLIDIVEPNADRAAPICPHFGTCGGCSLQMMPLPATRELKRGFVATALSRAGVAAEVEETIGVPTASRRRAVLTAVRTAAGVTLGFNERLSNRVVDIALCPVLMPALAGRLDGIRQTIAPLLPVGRCVRVTALLTQTGLDLDLDDAARPGGQALSGLARLAGAHAIARISIAGEPILTLAEPTIEIAGVPLIPRPARSCRPRQRLRRRCASSSSGISRKVGASPTSFPASALLHWPWRGTLRSVPWRRTNPRSLRLTRRCARRAA